MKITSEATEPTDTAITPNATPQMIKFSTGKSLLDNKPKNHDQLTFKDLCNQFFVFNKELTVDLKEHSKTIDGTIEKALKDIKESKVAYITSYCKNNKRNKENMPFRYWLMLDFDNVKAVTKEPVYSDFEVFKSEIVKSLESYQYVIYTTFSHTEVIPKLRVVIVLSEPVADKDYKHIATAFIEEALSERLIEALDTDASTDYAKVMLLPIINNCFDSIEISKYIPWRYFKEEGATIDVSKYKSLAANSNTKLGKRGRPRKDTTQNTEQAPDDLTIFCNNQPLDITDDEVRKILFELPITEFRNYNKWRNVCLGLHHQFKGDEKGLNLFLEWSKQDPEEFDEEEARKQWKGCMLDNPNPITFATILAYHKELNSENEIPWIDKNTYKQPLHTLINFRVFTKVNGISINFNEIKHTNDIVFTKQEIPLGSYHNKGNDNITDIQSLSIKNSFIKNKELLMNYTFRVANENPYNPLKAAIENTTWDGISRINDFYDIVSVSSEYEAIKSIYLKKWLLQFLYITCFNNEPKALVARQVLVFCGKQNIGKTTWFKNLLPDEFNEYLLAGQKLNLENEMSKKNCLEHALVELGELGSTFRKSDQDELKSFLSADTDKLNIKYLPVHQTFRRRTCFFASVNDSNFLQDRTGNSRFLVLSVLSIKQTEIDMMQLYAELLHDEKTTQNFKLREKAYELTWEEKQEQEKINKNHTSLCPVEEELDGYFDFSKPCDDEYKKYDRVMDIFFEMRGNNEKPNKKELNAASQFLENKGLKDGRICYLPKKRGHPNQF